MACSNSFNENDSREAVGNLPGLSLNEQQAIAAIYQIIYLLDLYREY